MSRLRVSATALAVVALLVLASSSPADAQNKNGGAKKSSGNKKRPASKKRVSARAALVKGDATWYDSINNGFCGFGTALPADNFIVAVPTATTQSQPLGAACGSCLAVFCRPSFVTNAYGSYNLDRTNTCASSTQGIVVRVTDTCSCSGNPEWCCGGGADGGSKPHLDLSKQAFAALITDVNLGIMAIEWASVSCDLIGSRVTRASLGGAALVTTAEVVRPPPAIVVVAPTPPKPVVVAKPPPKPVAAAKPPPKRPTVAKPPPKRPTVAKPVAPAANKPVALARPPAGCEDGSCPAPDPAAFAAAAAKLCKTPGLWAQASSVPLAVSRRELAPNEMCGGAGAFCCAYARLIANGRQVAGSCRDAPFAGRSCGKGTKCVRQDAYYWQCK